jgi:hypothetical protein
MSVSDAAYRRLHGALAISIVTLSMLATASVAAAHVDHGMGYSYKSTPCTNTTAFRADPITVVFHGPGANSAGRVRFILDWILRWKHRSLDESQHFWDHGECLENNVQGANVPLYDPFNGGVQKRSRWHIRGRFQGGHPKNWTVLTPHRDVWHPRYQNSDGDVKCAGKQVGPIDPKGKHYVHRNAGRGSGYDRGREAVVGKLRRWYQDHYPWGNDRTMKQCNGQLAGSSGYVAYFNFG